MTHALHNARISKDKRVLYNDADTMMVRLLSHLLDSYMTRVLCTARISNDERALYNDTKRLIVWLQRWFTCDTYSACFAMIADEKGN